MSLESYQIFSDVVKTIKTSTSAEQAKEIIKSEDYQRLYDSEIQSQALELLEIPEMVLSQYDWETIDSLVDKVGNQVYDNQGEVVYFDYQEPEQKVTSVVSPEKANLIYRIQNESFSDVQKALSSYRSTFSGMLDNFGFHKSKNSELIAGFPSYTATGSPRYDLEISFVDVDAVNGYKVYLIEEDGII